MQTKSIRFEYDKSDELKSLIEDTYFLNGNNGKLDEGKVSQLIFNKDDVIYQILTGLDYDVKFRNEDVIDGSMRFSTTEGIDNIILTPISKYCIKVKGKKDNKERYCFY